MAWGKILTSPGGLLALSAVGGAVHQASEDQRTLDKYMAEQAQKNQEQMQKSLAADEEQKKWEEQQRLINFRDVLPQNPSAAYDLAAGISPKVGGGARGALAGAAQETFDRQSYDRSSKEIEDYNKTEQDKAKTELERMNRITQAKQSILSSATPATSYEALLGDPGIGADLLTDKTFGTKVKQAQAERSKENRKGSSDEDRKAQDLVNGAKVLQALEEGKPISEVMSLIKGFHSKGQGIDAYTKDLLEKQIGYKTEIEPVTQDSKQSPLGYSFGGPPTATGETGDVAQAAPPATSGQPLSFAPPPGNFWDAYSQPPAPLIGTPVPASNLSESQNAALASQSAPQPPPTGSAVGSPAPSQPQDSGPRMGVAPGGGVGVPDTARVALPTGVDVNTPEGRMEAAIQALVTTLGISRDEALQKIQQGASQKTAPAAPPPAAPAPAPAAPPPAVTPSAVTPSAGGGALVPPGGFTPDQLAQMTQPAPPDTSLQGMADPAIQAATTGQLQPPGTPLPPPAPPDTSLQGMVAPAIQAATTGQLQPPGSPVVPPTPPTPPPVGMPAAAGMTPESMGAPPAGNLTPEQNAAIAAGSTTATINGRTAVGTTTVNGKVVDQAGADAADAELAQFKAGMGNQSAEDPGGFAPGSYPMTPALQTEVDQVTKSDIRRHLWKTETQDETQGVIDFFLKAKPGRPYEEAAAMAMAYFDKEK